MAHAPRNSKPGKPWHTVTDANIIAQMKADKAGTSDDSRCIGEEGKPGRGLTYKEIEIKYGLRQNNGMSAYNIVNDKPKPKPKAKKQAKPAEDIPAEEAPDNEHMAEMQLEPENVPA